MDVQGDRSTSSFNHFEASVNYKLWRHLYLTGGFDMYIRHTDYRLTIWDGRTETSNPRIASKQLGAHLMLTYKF